MSRKRSTGPAWMAVAALAGLVSTVLTPFASGGVERTAGSGRLALHAEFALKQSTVDCPGGEDPHLFCFSSVGKGVVAGLGKVSESYLRRVEESPPGCDPDFFHVLSQTVRFTVAGKGEIQLVVPAIEGCVPHGALDKPDYPRFTITGGSGAFTGASGTGKLTQLSAVVAAAPKPAPISGSGTSSFPALSSM